jgi:MFS family permease
VTRRPALAILFVIVFVDLLGFGMVMPVMALYAQQLGAPVTSTGLLSTGYSLMQFVFAPIWGRLSDRVGRRPVLLVSIFMTAAAFLVYGLAGSFAVLLGSRLFAGAATANIAIARAYVADVTAPQDRARGMGLIGAAFGLGFVLGPVAGGLLAHVSLATPGLAAAGLAAVNGVAALLALPEPERRSVRAAAARPRPRSRVRTWPDARRARVAATMVGVERPVVFRHPTLGLLGVLGLAVCATPVAFAALALPVVYLVPVGVAVWLLRARTTVDGEAIHVRGVLRTRRVPWPDVTALRMRASRRRSGVSAMLRGGTELSLPAVRPRDLSLLARASGGRLPDPLAPGPPAAEGPPAPPTPPDPGSTGPVGEPSDEE